MDTPSTALDLVQQFGVGGILVRGVTPTLAADIAAISRSAGDIAPVFGADEEGGRAQRLRDLLGVIPSARRMAQKMTPTEVRKLAFAHGQRMREIGLTMNLAPVLDLDDTPGPAIGSRSFSSDPDVAARFGAAFAQGMLDAGVFPVVKHFPGLGHADNDSHLASASTSGIDTLRSLDIVPFRRVLAKMPVGVMVAHVRIRGFDEAPASVSSALVTGVIRGELGFRGLIVTDALSMLPIRSRFGVGEAAVTALRSGSDLLLFDEEHDVAPIIDALVSAAGDPEVANRLLDATMRVLSATTGAALSTS